MCSSDLTKELVGVVTRLLKRGSATVAHKRVQQSEDAEADEDLLDMLPELVDAMPCSMFAERARRLSADALSEFLDLLRTDGATATSRGDWLAMEPLIPRLHGPGSLLRVYELYVLRADGEDGAPVLFGPRASESCLDCPEFHPLRMAWSD